MTQKKMLIDTCSYLRVAYTLHPLLGQPYGKDSKTLYVLKESEREFNGIAKYHSDKFSWVMGVEFTTSRKKSGYPTIANKTKPEILEMRNFIEEYNMDEGDHLSEIDQIYMAHSIVLGYPIVTDEKWITQAAPEFNFEVMDSIELMYDMVQESKIDLDMVNKAILFIKSNNDWISNLEESYKKLLGKHSPKLE